MHPSSYFRLDVVETTLSGVKLVRSHCHADHRGFFTEAFNAKNFAAAGLPIHFVQDNISVSHQWVLRGLHYQVKEPQAKLIRVLAGEIWDVVVDVRPRSSSFGQWLGMSLSPTINEWLFVPEGFAHGFLAISEVATVLYKTTTYRHTEGERSIRWNDPTLGIQWPLPPGQLPTLSPGDADGQSFSQAELPSTL